MKISPKTTDHRGNRRVIPIFWSSVRPSAGTNGTSALEPGSNASFTVFKMLPHRAGLLPHPPLQSSGTQRELEDGAGQSDSTYSPQKSKGLFRSPDGNAATERETNSSAGSFILRF